MPCFMSIVSFTEEIYTIKMSEETVEDNGIEPLAVLSAHLKYCCEVFSKVFEWKTLILFVGTVNITCV